MAGVLEAQWIRKRGQDGRAVGTCGSQECDEAVADLEDRGLEWEVTIRPGYVQSDPQPEGLDADYLVFSRRWQDRRPARSKERAQGLKNVQKMIAGLPGVPDPQGYKTADGLPPQQTRTLGPTEGVYVKCKGKGCFAITKVQGGTRWADTGDR